MANIILRPNATGTYEQWEWQYPGTGYHWDKLDEEVADDHDTEIAQTNVTGMVDDTFNYPSHGSVYGKITNVRFYAKYQVRSQQHPVYSTLITHSTLYRNQLPEIPLSVWRTNYVQYDTNPNTGIAWTWDEIDDLEAGVSTSMISIIGAIHVTKVYLYIFYSEWLDKGLRIYDGSAVKRVAVAPLLGTHKVRIRIGGTTYGVPRLATDHPQALVKSRVRTTVTRAFGDLDRTS